MTAEGRLSNLERLVEQQQHQIKQLEDFGTRLSNEFLRLHSDHAELSEKLKALSDCLVSQSTLKLEHFRARSRVSWGLKLLQTGLDNSRVLDNVKQCIFKGSEENPCVDLGRLSLSSRGFEPLRKSLAKAAKLSAKKRQVQNGKDENHKEDNSAKSSSSPVPPLDEKAWIELCRYEPPEEVLKRWECSDVVADILRNYYDESIVGTTYRLKHSSVQRLLSSIGISLEQFVSRFGFAASLTKRRKASVVEGMACSIFRKFAGDNAADKDTIHCRDLYRLLEMMGYPFRRFTAVFTEVDPDSIDGQPRLQLGNYRICREMGSGSKGVCCYLGEHTTNGTKVAIKWPVDRNEVATFKDIQQHAPKDGLGLPRLFASGVYQSQSFVVTELLGWSLNKLFQRLAGQSPEQRWSTLQVVGRLLVRRLRVLHSCGYVHCDVSPENVLLGHARLGTGLFAPYLIDFGLARRYPGGDPLPAHQGSMEWSSINSGNGSLRLPHDDLEALGWVLVHGQCGSLPWLEWLQWAYKDFESAWVQRMAVRQARQAKLQLLSHGWQSFGVRKYVPVPGVLIDFIKKCQPIASMENGGTMPAPPDYQALEQLLGGDATEESSNGEHNLEVERQDLTTFSEHLKRLLKT